MPLLVALLVVAVHLAIGVGSWQGVGLLADDHHMIGGAVLRHRGDWTLASAFAPAPVGDAPVALYRPFLDLGFWLEQPWFGVSAFGYHITNSALHCLTAMLWFGLVRRWTGSIWAAAATAIGFVGWPGHSEVTHWIAARTNLQSMAFASLALLVHDVGLGRRGAVRWLLFALAAIASVVAVGTKESAVLIGPVVAVVTWQRLAHAGRFPARAVQSLLAVAPMASAMLGWLAWRAHCLGTWGSGTTYGWHAHRLGADTCRDWAQVLLAPTHHAYVGFAPWCALALVQGTLFVLGLGSLRAASARAAAVPALLLLGLGYLAGIGLESLDPDSLENVRYTYEPALGIAVLGGLGLAALPARARVPALVVVAALHAFVLHGNRQAWLRVSSVYERMRSDVAATALRTQQPLQVFDAPGVHDGAFGYLNGHTEFLFWQQTMPPGTNLRGGVASTMEWTRSLQDLATAAAAGVPLQNAFVVRWSDGTLVPVVVGGTWPREPWPGTRLDFARIARERPFVGDEVPVHVLLQTDHALELQVEATCGPQRWQGPRVDAAATDRPTPFALAIELPPTVAPDTPVEVTLRLRRAGSETELPLGSIVPAAR